MNEQERKQRDEETSRRVRKSTARYVAQLRGEGLPEAEIQRMVEGAALEVMGELSPDEEVPTEVYQAISVLVKSVMENG